jgi:hypothetical protein
LTGTHRIECRWIVEEPDADSYHQIIQTTAQAGALGCNVRMGTGPAPDFT